MIFYLIIDNPYLTSQKDCLYVSITLPFLNDQASRPRARISIVLAFRLTVARKYKLSYESTILHKEEGLSLILVQRRGLKRQATIWQSRASIFLSGVGDGWAGRAIAYTRFGISVNQRGRLCPQLYYSPTQISVAPYAPAYSNKEFCIGTNFALKSSERADRNANL